MLTCRVQCHPSITPERPKAVVGGITRRQCRETVMEGIHLVVTPVVGSARKGASAGTCVPHASLARLFAIQVCRHVDPACAGDRATRTAYRRRSTNTDQSGSLLRPLIGFWETLHNRISGSPRPQVVSVMLCVWIAFGLRVFLIFSHLGEEHGAAELLGM